MASFHTFSTGTSTTSLLVIVSSLSLSSYDIVSLLFVWNVILLISPFSLTNSTFSTVAVNLFSFVKVIVLYSLPSIKIVTSHSSPVVFVALTNKFAVEV